MSIKGKATSLDIAHLAGVSQPTVSRALRNSPLVSEETREKVQRIARELNYKVDKNASNLRCQTSGTLALLLFEDPGLDDSLINPFFVSMLSSITRACGQRGFDLLISFQQLSDDWHADYEDSKKADGLILLGYGDYLEYQARLEQLVRQKTHFVRWGAVLPGQPGISIGSDNRQGGRDITAHLIARGRSRIAFIGNATDHYPEFFGRYRGYLDALQAAGITADPLLQVDARQSSEEAGQEAIENLKKRGVQFDAIFAASDLIAIGAMRALRERAIDVPGDVAVAGFDDLPMAAMTNPALTTVQQDTRLAGQVLVETLIASIRGEEVQARTIPTRLAIRRSCGAA
ncbi:MAG TPA: LacI family DNA-binding transcriptional regulator [Xanthomonadaceae bacterium]|nr:LacI family DNA-binding transcriptional regulator [Xanthomonadaceae bacterium]